MCFLSFCSTLNETIGLTCGGGGIQKKYRFPVAFHLETGSGRINAPHGGRYYTGLRPAIKKVKPARIGDLIVACF